MSVFLAALAAVVFLNVICIPVNAIKVNGKIDAVVLSAGHSHVFEKSMLSAMKYLVDVDLFYVLTPKATEMQKKSGELFGKRVVFIDEKIYPINWVNVSEVMIQSVKDKGVYPLTGKSAFEQTVYGRIGWFLQQVLKLHAGRILSLDDYVLLDSDLVWLQNVTFIHENKGSLSSFYYASSTQYHPPYMASLVRTAGVNVYENTTERIHRSGIVHHMVIVKSVLEELIRVSEVRHKLPFWQILLNQSAIEMTCRAPRASICGGGSTLSEYELYFNFAKSKFPQTIQHRPLMWTNGPAPGYLFWPPMESVDPGKIHWDGSRNNWMGHRQNQVPEVLTRQIAADTAAGFDYVGYHGYAKRRYFELHGVDVKAMCSKPNRPLPAARNSTCSYRGLELPENKHISVDSWFAGCACHMAT